MPPRHRHSRTSLPGTRRAVAAAALAGLLALVPGSPADDGCTTTWDGGAGSVRWSDAANWSGDSRPGPSDVVCLPAGAAPRYDGTDGSIAGLRGGGVLTIASGGLRVGG